MRESNRRSTGSATDWADLPEVCRPLAERSHVPTIAVEGSTHLVGYANPAFRRLVGKQPRDLIGLRFDDAVAAGKPNGCAEMIDRVFATGAHEQLAKQDPELRIMGEPYVHWSLSMSAVLAPDDVPLGVMIQVADLTATEAFIKELAGMNQALLLSALRQDELREASNASHEEIADRLLQSESAQEALRTIAALLEMKVIERTSALKQANHDLEEFAYSVAHNLRAPLRAIVATSAVLREEVRTLLSPSQANQFEKQAERALKVAGLIDDLLGHARLAGRTMQLGPVDLSAIVTSLAMEIVPAYPDRLLNFDIEEGLVADTDRASMTVLLHSLIDNAAKFSPNGGMISFGKGEEDGAFYVRDEGIGFDMVHGAKLFTPFERLVGEHDFPGNGIGLANVRHIVERHGGKVRAESAVGEGATFFFTLG